MEQQPHHNLDDDPEGFDPCLQRLHERGIDLSETTPHDAALVEVVSEAIDEALGKAHDEALVSGVEVPAWVARVIARALAAHLADPTGSALHNFAISGHADSEAIRPELTAIRQTADFQIKLWLTCIEIYLEDLPKEPRAEQ